MNTHSLLSVCIQTNRSGRTQVSEKSRLFIPRLLPPALNLELVGFGSVELGRSC